MKDEQAKQGLTCPLTGCPFEKLLLSTVAVFITIFAFEWVFHGMYMMPVYEATASLWRTMEESQSLMHYSLIRTFVAALMISALYCWGSKATGCHGGGLVFGLRFGLVIGLLLGGWEFSTYVWMPIPFDMAVSWLVGCVIMGVLIGIVLSLLPCRSE